MDNIEQKFSLTNLEREVPRPTEVRLHHITSLYYTLCLSLEEQARTPMFNDANVYGEEFAMKMQEFYEDILCQPDEAQIKIVGSLDDICKDCPRVNEHCQSEDEQRDYEVPRSLGINVGDVVIIGDLKRRLQQFYAEDDAPWKDKRWNERLEKYPRLARYTKENFWLYQRRQQEE